MNYFFKFLTLGLLLLTSHFSWGQKHVGLFSPSFPTNPSGPLYTTNPGTLLTSTGQGYYTGPVTVSASFQNQQYGTLPGGNTGNGDLGLMFGVTNNASEKTPTPTTLSGPLASVGSPVASFFSPTANSIGTGISLSGANALNGYSLFTSAEGLVGQPTDGKYYMGDLVFTFSAPVNNPILHLSGLGGIISIDDADLGYPTLPFVTDLELASTGLDITRLSGSSRLSYDAVTKTIYNSYTGTDFENTFQPPTNGGLAGSGSLQITGTGITTVTFRIYLRGLISDMLWCFQNQYLYTSCR